MVKGVFGRDEALGIDGVKIAQVYVSKGDVLKTVRSSLDRHGHIIAEGQFADEAINRARAGSRSIKILTGEDGG